MPDDALLFRKLNAFLEPRPEEVALIRALTERRCELAPGAMLVREGEANDCAYALLSGWAIRFRTLDDGRRQILNVVLPGDMLALDAHVIDPAPASAAAITACHAAVFPPADILRMLAEQPRLAGALLWATAREEAFLGERLVSLGRRAAIDRVGHFFVELYHRLRLIGLAEETSFRVPLNLDHISDALGLSVVHASRTFGRLRNLNLLVRRGAAITLPDRAQLEARVEFPGLYLPRRLGAGERYLRAAFAANPSPGPALPALRAGDRGL